MDRPIPAFYCCYLLRSTVSQRALPYIGSTPHAVRRLKQHNGESKGGAVRTSRASLRPWEMACIVTGFPSKIAALQFEWAWQHTHLSRHTSEEDRLEARKHYNHTSRSGKTRKRIVRPRLTIDANLKNLHLLLHVKSFRRWPLTVKFFAADVFKKWEAYCKGRNALQLRDSIKIEYLPAEGRSFPTTNDQGVITAPAADPQNTGVYALDFGYAHCKPYLEKTKTILESEKRRVCAVCREPLAPAKDKLLLVCPEGDCEMTSHLTCLSKHFLSEDVDRDAIVPTHGHCPSCRSQIQWSTMVKGLSLRLRGQKEMDALFKKPRQKKTAAQKTADPEPSDEEEANASETDHVGYSDFEDIDKIAPLVKPSRVGSKAPGGGPVFQMDGLLSSEDDLPELSKPSPPKKKKKTPPPRSFTKKPSSALIVIEDSESDDALSPG